MARGMVTATRQRANGLVEDYCECGVGHPNRELTPTKFYYGVHGCCGCCMKDTWVRGTALSSGRPVFTDPRKALDF